MTSEKDNTMRINSNAINIIRVCSAIFIFLCHAMSSLNIGIFNAMAQLFNVGVPIFFMISGYLYSDKVIHGGGWKNIKWYLKRLQKIIVPLWIFLIAVLCAHLFVSHNIDFSVWICNFIPLAGLCWKHISGCGHLWFISHILICYGITPLLMMRKEFKKYLLALFAVIYLSILCFAGAMSTHFAMLVSSLASYLIGFYVLSRFDFNIISATILGLFGTVGRLIGKRLFDGTFIYDNFVSAICHQALAMSIIILIMLVSNYLTTKNKVKRLFDLSKSLSKYTYEFYLVHYVFITGILAINVFESKVLNLIVAFIVSCISAVVLGLATKGVNSIISKVRVRKQTNC